MATEIYESEIGRGWRTYIPAGVAIAGAFVMLGLRLQLGERFISDGALMMLALACYIFAALFHLTNLYAPSEMARKIGLWMRRKLWKAFVPPIGIRSTGFYAGRGIRTSVPRT